MFNQIKKVCKIKGGKQKEGLSVKTTTTTHAKQGVREKGNERKRKKERKKEERERERER